VLLAIGVAVLVWSGYQPRIFTWVLEVLLAVTGGVLVALYPASGSPTWSTC
jgi:hypothetical protein